MTEYIDKQAAIDNIEKSFDKETILNRFVRKIAISAVRRMEPADVRPVVRGRWEVVDWVEHDGHGECVHYPKEGLCCTNCKNAFKKKLLWKDNYCPNCGADMRGEG